MTPSRARASRTVRWSGKTATGLRALPWLGSSRNRRRWLRAKTDPLAHAPGADPELQLRPKGTRYGAAARELWHPVWVNRQWRDTAAWMPVHRPAPRVGPGES